MQKEIYRYPQLSTIPVAVSSGRSNPLLHWRDRLLDRAAGTSRYLPINAAAEHSAPAADDLAGEIRRTLQQLKAETMQRNGTAVNYTALRHHPEYRIYKQELLGALRRFNPQRLTAVNAARAFWINLYNALTIDAVIQFGVQESVTAGTLGIFTFFRRAAYLVHGRRVSLEDIEHGILRGNRGNPYIPGVHFPSDDPRLAWSLPVEPRVHFALNCGGRSCPPIHSYDAANLNRQLTMAARHFVHSNVAIYPERNSVILSPIFRWYAADFGGREGMLQFLCDHLPQDSRRDWLRSRPATLRFRYTPHDWRLNQSLPR